MLYAIIALLVIILDQWVKFWVAGAIPLESTGVGLIPGVISLVNVHNTGAAFSLFAGSNARIYFIIITAVFTLAVIIALATKFISGTASRWALVLMTAGGLSNCIDRVIYGYVQDMFKFEPLPKFPVFNVADIVLTVFCFVFVLAVIFEKDRRKDQDYDDLYNAEDEEEEEEEEIPAPKKASRKAQKKARREYYEEEEEEPAPRPARQPKAEPERQPSRRERQAMYDEEYERIKAQREARRRAEAEEELDFSPREEPKPAPAPKAEPKPQPEPEPKAQPETYSLEDILAEFDK